MGETPDQTGHEFHIQIDREHFTVHQRTLTGAQLRQLPTPPDRPRPGPVRGRPRPPGPEDRKR